MKSLKRNDKGELMLTNSDKPEPTNDFCVEEMMSETEVPLETSIEHSPIVTETNFPAQAAAKAKPSKQSIATSLLTEEQLLTEMRKAGGKNLTTSQFAILITPCVKKTVDAAEHHRWDLSLGYVRFLMRKLEKQGKIIITKDTSSKRTRYLYSLT